MFSASMMIALGLTGLGQMPGAAGAPDAETIMARVAANQDRSEIERSHFVYVQHARVTSRKGKTVRCEETTDSRVTPSADGSHQELLKLEGRLLVKGKYVEYTALPRVATQGGSTTTSHDDDMSINLGDDEMDREMVESMRSKLTDRRSKDGIAAGLFPLTSKMQAEYKFQLLGREPMNGRQTFHIGFEPKEKSDSDWKGEVYVDADAFEPVLIRTRLFHNVPVAVRTLLGTSVPGLGFTAIYAPQTGGVWFPVSFGTEFKVRVLFFFRREVTVSAANRDFERTHVSSTIVATAP